MGQTRFELLAQLRRDLTTGALAPGGRLPPERELAASAGLSRTDVRSVLDALEADGVIVRRVGRSGGTFVVGAPVERVLGSSNAVPDLLAEQGFSYSARVVSTRVTRPGLDESLALGPGVGHMFEVTRVRLANGLALSVDTARFPLERFPHLPSLDLAGSLYRALIDRYGVFPASVTEIIEAVGADVRLASLLEVAVGSALLCVVRTAFDEHGVPFEFSRDMFRGDRMRGVVRGLSARFR